MRRARSLLIAVIAALAATAGGARAGQALVYGMQDDAWIAFGPGTAQERVSTLQRLGFGIMRVTVRWDVVEATQGTFDWSVPDAVLQPLDEAGIEAVVTLYGTPSWANGGRAANVAPTSAADFARFAGAAAEHYPSVRRWTIWNEPNQRRWLSTASRPCST